MSNPESVRLRNGQTVAVSELTAIELYSLGARDASTKDVPQTFNEDYQSGWKSSIQAAKQERIWEKERSQWRSKHI